jgi:hypothetical protein
MGRPLIGSGCGPELCAHLCRVWLAVADWRVVRFLRGPLLVVAVLVGTFIIWVKLCMRYPRTMFVITAFLRGLLSRR